MSKEVNRQASSYHSEVIGHKNDLDYMASALLAISYSRRANSSSKSQSLIQYDCVAVCIVEDEGIWIASNSKQITDADIKEFRQYLNSSWATKPIWTVTNGSSAMHAEMQLVKELFDNKKSTKYIGVSKPCCMQCRQVLQNCNIQFSCYHTSTVTNWESPF